MKFEIHRPCVPSEQIVCRPVVSWRWLILLATLFFDVISLPAQPTANPDPNVLGAPTGVIEGRVSDSEGAVFLEKVRVTVEGAAIETFTDNSGYYKLAGVPVGSATVRAFRTGLAVRATTVSVVAARATPLDLKMPPIEESTDGTPVKLSAFHVSAQREMNGAAIAINEQRFAPDIRNVIAADEFGAKGDGAIGELLQFLPGIAVTTSNGNAISASLGGVPAEYVPFTNNGFDMASAKEGTSRQVSLTNLPSSNNIARVEVLHSPTPESPGMALAGSINLVPLSAFERSKPVLSLSVFMMGRDDEPLTLNRTPGPGRESTRKIHPGFNFSYIRPVNDHFGFTLSGGASLQYLRTENLATVWKGVGSPTNGGTFPDTTPAQPYLTQYAISSFHNATSRQSMGLTVDYRIGYSEKLSYSFAYVKNYQSINNPALTINITRVQPTDFSPVFTHGFAGAGDLSLVNNDRDPTDVNYTNSLVYRHNGTIWKAQAGVSHSSSFWVVQNASIGEFFNGTARRTGVTVAFDDINYVRPDLITVKSAETGQAINPYDLNNYLLASATVHSLDNSGSLGKNQNKVTAVQQSAYANLAREFAGQVPLSLKAGLDLRRHQRDLRGGQDTYSFVGADGRTTTTLVGTDDGAGIVLDPSNTLSAYGVGPVQLVSNTRWYDLYKARPTYFTTNESTNYRSVVTNSKYAQEIISSAFLRSDAQLLDRRIKLTGGVRAEQTNIDAEGPLTDLTRNYRRDANGTVIRAANGTPVPITSDPLGADKLTRIDRGLHVAKEYLRWFPSLNGSFNWRENVVARAAYYYSVGRPNFNQYAGGVTLPDVEAANASAQRIVVNNAGIKAWSARTMKLMLEYYFDKVGLVSVGAFRRDFDNFFGAVVSEATPEFLAFYSIDPSVYGRYLVSTQTNLASSVRMEGVDFNYKQALTFLPHWARGIQIFANMSALRAIGEESANFAGFVPRTYSWGGNLSRDRFGLKLNWNYRGRNRQNIVADGRSIAPDTYRWGTSQHYFNLSGEYFVRRNLSLYLNYNSPVKNGVEIVNASTPANARLTSLQQYGGLWTFGIKTVF